MVLVMLTLLVALGRLLLLLGEHYVSALVLDSGCLWCASGASGASSASGGGCGNGASVLVVLVLYGANCASSTSGASGASGAGGATVGDTNQVEKQGEAKKHMHTNS